MASASTGSTCSSMNSRTRSSSAATRSEGAKSMDRSLSRSYPPWIAARPSARRAAAPPITAPTSSTGPGRAAGASVGPSCVWGSSSRAVPHAGLRHEEHRAGRRRGSPGRRSRGCGEACSARPPRAASLDQLGLSLVAPARHAHELALGEQRVDLARAAVGVARRVQRLGAWPHERHAAARAEALVGPCSSRPQPGHELSRQGVPPPPPRPSDPPGAIDGGSSSETIRYSQSGYSARLMSVCETARRGCEGASGRSRRYGRPRHRACRPRAGSPRRARSRRATGACCARLTPSTELVSWPGSRSTRWGLLARAPPARPSAPAGSAPHCRAQTPRDQGSDPPSPHHSRGLRPLWRRPASLTRRGALGAGAALVLASCGGGDPAPAGRAGPGSGVACSARCWRSSEP